MTEWRFRRMQPGEMNIDPIEGEFFSTATLDSITDALVREAIQNSLDASRPDECTRVRIAFPPAASPDTFEKYTAGLWRHLEATRSGLAALPDPRAPIPILLVEDFNTRGLQGDPAQSEDTEIDAPGERNDFYYFWRNVGRTRKSSSELGRWGLGKTVFPAASGINSFLALTKRVDDGRELLMGQSVLRIHKVDGVRYYPYGYFASFDGDFARPFEEPSLLARFRQDCGLGRQDEPGLSVLVPWPDPEITPHSALLSVIRHYFVPILSGDLVVEFATAQGIGQLDHDSLPRVLSEKRFLAVGADMSGRALEIEASLERLIALARFGRDTPRSRHVRLADPPSAPAPKWDPGCLENAPADLQERFDAGLPLAFTVPTWVKPAAADPELSEFDVYIQRDETLARPDEHFVREGITIAGVRGGLARGIRAIVVACHPPIAGLLGDAENPAHTEWQERSPKFKGRYHHGPSTLRFVRNAPRELARALTRPALGRNEQLLQHLFSLHMPTENIVIESLRDPSESPGEGENADGSGATGSSQTPFQVQRVPGGFRLVGTGEGQTPSHAVVRVAYEVRNGDPFGRYQKPDFDLGDTPIRIASDGATIEQARGNAIVARIETPRFRVSVEGFDLQRDIRVRVSPEEVRR